MFLWTHEGNKGKNTVNVPVSIAKCVSNGNGVPTGKLICNDCEKPLTQKYVCDCGKNYSIGQIEKRFDEESDVIYPYKEKNAYLKSKAKNEIKVIGEMDLVDVIKNLEFVDSFNEVYNNQAKSLMNKIHKWLDKKQKALIVTYGHRGSNNCGVIIASGERLLLTKFRDHRNIRPPKQQEIIPLENRERSSFSVLSEDPTPDLYEEYIEKLKKGDKVPIKKTMEEESMEMTEIGFLDE